MVWYISMQQLRLVDTLYGRAPKAVHESADVQEVGANVDEEGRCVPGRWKWLE